MFYIIVNTAALLGGIYPFQMRKLKPQERSSRSPIDGLVSAGAAPGRSLRAPRLLASTAAGGRPERPGPGPCRPDHARAAAARRWSTGRAAASARRRAPRAGRAEPARAAPAAATGGRSAPGPGPGRRRGGGAGRAGRRASWAPARARHHCRSFDRHRRLPSQGAGAPRVRPLLRVGEPHRGRPEPAGAWGPGLSMGAVCGSLSPPLHLSPSLSVSVLGLSPSSLFSLHVLSLSFGNLLVSVCAIPCP